MKKLSIALSGTFLCASQLVACAADVDEAPVEEEVVGESAHEIHDGFATFPYGTRSVKINGCSGTMIAPNWALTAAHCFPGSKDPSTVTVTLVSESRKATHLLVHPQAGNFTGDNDANVDVALVRIGTPFSALSWGTRPYIFSGDSAALWGDTVDCYGYGAQDFYGSCTTSAQCNSGDWCQWGVCMVSSPTLRWGTFSIIPDWTNPDVYFQLSVPNANGQIPLPGDSGGACWVPGGNTIVGTTKAGNASNYSRYISGEAFGAWASARRDCAAYDPRSPSTTQCSAGCPCDVGEGDCDSSSECRPGLTCVSNVGPKYGLPADYDMCEPLALCPEMVGGPSTGFCTNPACPCTYGQGDCDSDYECGGGLVCRDNIGPAVGLPADHDVCVYPTDPGCPAYNVLSPNPSHCSAACPCDLGEGDCDSNSECRPGLVCGNNNGATFGLPADYEVCVKP